MISDHGFAVTTLKFSLIFAVNGRGFRCRVPLLASTYYVIHNNNILSEKHEIGLISLSFGGSERYTTTAIRNSVESELYFISRQADGSTR